MKRVLGFMNKIPPVNDFVSTWDTSKTSAGSSTSTQVKLPIYSGGTYNFDVDWGDSSSSTITAWNDAAVTHTYSSAGTYTITITGIINGWRFNTTGDRLKLTSIASWGSLKVGNLGSYFYGCANLNLSSVSDILDLTGVTNLSAMFQNCTNLSTINNLNSWDTSLVTNMSTMFACAYDTKGYFNQAISFSAASCTNMSYMFSNIRFNSAITFVPSSVTNMSFMFFNNNTFNQAINWTATACTDTSLMFNNATAFNSSLVLTGSNVTNRTSMFQGATAFNQDVGALDVSKATTLASMFQGATAFNNGGNANINNWVLKNTGTVNLNYIFYLATNFNQNISSWNVSKVSTMVLSFGGATAFNQNISAWTFTVLTSLEGTFQNATAFNQNIGSWATNLVVNFSATFSGATAFNQDLGSWNVSAGTVFSNFMQSKTPATFSTTNLDAIYNGWSALPSVKPTITITFGSAKYTAASSAGRAILTGAPNNWAITDGGI